MTSPTAAERVAVLGHVQRRHRHDQDHHDLARHERHDRDRHVGPAEDRRQRDADGRIGGRIRARALVGQLVRIGSQQRPRQERRRADEDHRDEVRTGELGQAEARRHRAGRRRPGSDRGRLRPSRPRRRARSPTRAGHPGRGRRRRTATAGSSELPKPIRNVPTSSSGSDDHRTASVATNAPPTPIAYPAASPFRRPRRTMTVDSVDSARRGPEDDGGTGDAAPQRRAAEVLGHDRGDRDGRDVAGAAQRHAGHQRPRAIAGERPRDGRATVRRPWPPMIRAALSPGRASAPRWRQPVRPPRVARPPAR